MSFNGAGQFIRLYNWQNDAANGLDILAPRMDAEMDGFATGLSNCITRDGQSPPTAAINWGGQNLLNVGTLTVATLNITGNEAVSGNVNATNATLTGTLGVAGATTLAVVTMASASITGNATVGGTLGVTGALTGGGTANFSGNVSAPNVVVSSQVQAGGSGNGFAILNTGSGANTGHIGFFNGAGSRQAYVGNILAGGPVDCKSENGGGWYFSGGPIVFGGVTTITSSNSTSGLSIIDGGTNGPNIKLQGSAGNKYIRTTGNSLEVINSAYSSVIFAVTDSGVVTVTQDVIRQGSGRHFFDLSVRSRAAISDGTAAPSGGVDGDIYFQYT